MASVAYSARSSARRRVSRRLGSAGPLTYAVLVVVSLASLFPLYWSFVVASHDNSAVSAYPPVQPETTRPGPAEQAALRALRQRRGAAGLPHWADVRAAARALARPRRGAGPLS